MSWVDTKFQTWFLIFQIAYLQNWESHEDFPKRQFEILDIPIYGLIYTFWNKYRNGWDEPRIGLNM